MPTITDRTPQTKVIAGPWDHIRNLQLAYPQYYKPSPVDLLLDAEVLPSLFTKSMVSGSPIEPIALNTLFG